MTFLEGLIQPLRPNHARGERYVFIDTKTMYQLDSCHSKDDDD